MPGKISARDEIAIMAKREGGIIDLIFQVEWPAVRLPADTPQDVVSAWMRLGGQGIKDIDTIEKWLDDDDES